MNIRLLLRSFYLRINNEFIVKNARRRFAVSDFKRKSKNISIISPKQRKEICDYWNQFTPIYKHLKWFNIYNATNPNSKDLKYYIPDDIYYSEIDRYFSNVRKSEYVDDKNLYDLIFYDTRMPKTIARKIGNSFYGEDYSILNEEQFLYSILHKKFVCKPSFFSEGGHGVRFFSTIENSLEEFKIWIRKQPDLIIQEAIEQHETLKKIHKESINTIRIITLLYKNNVYILSSVLRMGINGSNIDNASSGGIVCGINDDGTLHDIAYDVHANIYNEHPQGGAFGNYTIPYFSKCHELVKRLAPRISMVSRLVSWDLSIGTDGFPILIEANLTFGEIDFHQMCNGPIFGNLTDDILNEVLKKK